MQYTKKQYPKNEGETDRDHVLRVVSSNPKGYAPFIRSLDIAADINRSNGITFGERLYNWIYPGVGSACEQCSEPTKFKQLSHGYYQFCSYSCRAKHNESYKNGCTDHAKLQRKVAYDDDKQNIIAKAKATKINRYGTAGIPGAAAVARKLKISRYGVDVVNTITCATTMSQYIKDDLMTSDAIGNMLGISSSVVQSHARKLNVKFPKIKGTSKEELQLFNWIQSLGVDVISRDRSMGTEVDVLIPAHKVAIEYNGSYWHSPDNPLTSTTSKTHITKTELCNQAGVDLIHIFDSDWINKRDVVQSRIKRKLGLAHRVYARKLRIREVESHLAKQFFNDNHIQGSCIARKTYGLFTDNDDLVSCMSFGKPRYNQNFEWELLRFCSAKEMVVVGGATRLFKKFINDTSPSSIISYCDLRWGSGQVYSVLGMTCSGKTPPGYWLVDPKDPLKKTRHRTQFMKHKLIQLGHDPLLTEHEITKSMGLYRVYDCGTSKWEWRDL